MVYSVTTRDAWKVGSVALSPRWGCRFEGAMRILERIVD